MAPTVPQPPRSLVLPAALLALTALGPACSGGGGGGSDGGGTLLSLQVSTTTANLVASGAADWNHEFLFDGQLDVDAQEYVLTTQNPNTFATGAWGDLQVLILDPWIVPIGAHPRAGILRIVRVDTMEVITIEVDPTIGAAGGVHITLDDGGAITGPFPHDWENFEGILEAGIFQVFEEIAAYVHLGTVFTLDRFELIIDAIAGAFLNRDQLEALGPGQPFSVDDVCGTLPGGMPGSLEVAWTDVNTDGDLSDGDQLVVLFDECWCDRADRPDSLYSGVIVLNDIIGNDDPFTALAEPELSDFRERLTREVMTGVHEIVPDSETTTSASLFVSFVE